jgi:hypothetical protein
MQDRPMPDDDLKAWIEAVDTLDTSHVPTAEEMLAVGRDLGLSDALFERAKAEATTLRVRGQQFLDNGLPNEAVQVLEQARALEPWALDGLEQLGRAHLVLYQTTGTDQAKDAAERIARSLIDRLPDSPDGYELLKTLQQGRPRPRSFAVAGLVGAAFVMGAGLSVLWTGAGPASPPSPQPTVAVTQAPVGEFPIRIERGALPDGVELSVTGVDFLQKPQSSGWFLTVGVLTTNTAPVVVEELFLTIRALDADGKLLAAHDLEVTDANSPGLYQRDRKGGQAIIQSSADIGQPAQVAVHVERVKSEASTRGPGTPIPITWSTRQPADVDVALERREGGECKASLGRSLCSGIFVVENTGTVPIETLKLQAVFGESGVTSESYGASSSGPALAPGERQPFRVIKFIDGPVPNEAWALSVIRVDTP